jgi:hypothetical protein
MIFFFIHIHYNTIYYIIMNKENNFVMCIEVSPKSIYYTLVSNKSNMLNILNNIQISLNKNYIISPILVPVREIIYNFYINENIIVELDEELENAHYSILYNCNSKEEKELYSLLVIDKAQDKYILKFPQILIKSKKKFNKVLLNDIKNKISSENSDNYIINFYSIKEKIFSSHTNYKLSKNKRK